jgi:hypothetical protein
MLVEPLSRDLLSITLAELTGVVSQEEVIVEDGVLKTARDKKIEKCEQSNETDQKYKRPSDRLITTINGQTVVFEMFSTTMAVLRYQDPELTIKTALESGILAETGEVIEGRRIFSYRPRRNDREYYLYYTPTMELLMAERPAQLRLMAQTGLGLELSILDNKTYLPLVDMASDLGQYWFFWNRRASHEEIVEAIRNSGEKSERIDSVEEDHEKGLQFRVRTDSLSDTLTEKEIEVYGDEDQARQREEKKRNELLNLDPYQGFPRELTDFLKKVHSGRKTVRDGTRVITTLVYTPEIIEAVRAGLSAAGKMKEDQKENEVP